MHVHWGTEIKIVDSLILSPALYWLSERTNEHARLCAFYDALRCELFAQFIVFFSIVVIL